MKKHLSLLLAIGTSFACGTVCLSQDAGSPAGHSAVASSPAKLTTKPSASSTASATTSSTAKPSASAKAKHVMPSDSSKVGASAGAEAGAKSSKPSTSDAVPATPPGSAGVPPALSKPSASHIQKPGATSIKSASASTLPKPSPAVHKLVTKNPVKTTAHQKGGSPAIATKEGKPIWLGLKSAKLAAKLNHRPIFADFYTDWCGWCKIMDKSTFRNPTVEHYLAKNFVCMRLNAQDDGVGEELAMKYGVDGFPTFMVFDPHNKAVAQFSGYRNSKELIIELKEAQTKLTK